MISNPHRIGQLKLYAMDRDGFITHQFTHDEGNEFNGILRPVRKP